MMHFKLSKVTEDVDNMSDMLMAALELYHKFPPSSLTSEVEEILKQEELEKQEDEKRLEMRRKQLAASRALKKSRWHRLPSLSWIVVPLVVSIAGIVLYKALE